MRLYRGSDTVIDNSIILEANRPLDFGYGFYLTTDFDQAKKWAIRVKNRNNSLSSFVNSYEFCYEQAQKELNIILFDGPTREWLLFVCKNRKNVDTNKEYDLVIGPVFDDNVYQVISRFENGKYDLEETLKRLKEEKLCNQILFHTKKSLEFLKYIGAEEIR
jgi:hypothetical protein